MLDWITAPAASTNGTAAEHEAAAVAVGWTSGFKRFNRAVCPVARPTVPDAPRLWPNTMGPATRQADRSGDLGGQAQAVSRKIHVPGCDFNTIFVLILRLEIWDWTGLF